MLKADNCQKIVNRVANILDRNINIINLQGIVIASSNPKRIGAFHEGGKLCAASGSDVIITEKNKHLYRGCKEGINLPIQYKKKTIGIVGVTGNPEEIKPYGLLVKEIVELIVQENESAYQRELHQQALKNFVLEVVKGTEIKDEQIYISRAKFLGVRDLRKKIIVIGTVSEFSDDLKNTDEIKVQEIWERLQSYIKLYYRKEEVIIFHLYEGKFIMLLPYLDDQEESLLNLRKRILKEFKVGINFVIGEKCLYYKDYAKNYNRAIRLGQINLNKKISEKVIKVEKHEIPLLIDGLSTGDKKQYLEKYKRFFDPANNKLKEELVETVKIYFENNMNIGKASDLLFVHRNTISYRINKIKENFSIDITKSYDCMMLYLAICINEQPLHN